jgi:WD40 repeat protein
LASASRDKMAKLFNAVTGDSVTTFPGHNEQVFGVAVSSDGKRVISAGADKKLLAWKSEDGQKAAEAGGFGREVLALIGQGDKLISACADGKVYQHRGDGLALHKAYEGLTDEVFSVAYHEATQRVAGGSFSGDVRIWNAEDGQTVLNFIAAPGYAPTK